MANPWTGERRNGPNCLSEDLRLDTIEWWRDVVIQMLDEGVSWLSLRAEGEVAATGELLLSLAFDASGMDPGTYAVSLELQTNEAVFNTYCVPVTLTVTAPPCLADLDDSGVVDVADLIALVTAWGPCEGCPADLDGDGVVAVTDLLALLVGFGPCPD